MKRFIVIPNSKFTVENPFLALHSSDLFYMDFNSMNSIIICPVQNLKTSWIFVFLMTKCLLGGHWQMNGRNIIKLNDTHQKSKNSFYKMIISI